MSYLITESLVESILSKKPMHRKFLRTTLAFLNSAEMSDAERYINFLVKEGHSVADLAEAYLTIVDDMFREELYFKEVRAYRYSIYAQVAEKVYNNAGYMRRYMIGLALSSFWWTNHVILRRYFNDYLAGVKGDIYREIGPGHGLYFLDALKCDSFASYEGIDISKTSVEMTRKVVESGFFGNFPKARIYLSDFLAKDFPVLADILVIGEVLEHVERPELFLERAYSSTKTSASVFLTTCFNSPAIDHLYNPGSMDKIEELVLRSGFKIADSKLIPRQGCSLQECLAKSLPVNVALVLKK